MSNKKINFNVKMLFRIILFLIVLTTVNGIKCYYCNVTSKKDGCSNLESTVKDCGKNIDQCFQMRAEKVVIRDCYLGKGKHKCVISPISCYRCNSDNCNNARTIEVCYNNFLLVLIFEVMLIKIF